MRALEDGSYRVVPGENYGTPKELWGFRSAPVGGAPEAAARAFLRAHEALLGLQGVRAGLVRSAVLASLGAQHVILQQRHAGARVHRAYVTVHRGQKDRRIYLVKNRAVPRDRLPPPEEPRRTEEQALRIARRYVEARPSQTTLLQSELMWYPTDAGLRLAWRLRLGVERTSPKGAALHEEWLVYVDARSGEVLSAYDNLSEARARGRVFDPNPVIALGGDDRLLPVAGRRPAVPPEAYREVLLRDLEGTGFLDGKRVSTRASGAERLRSETGDFVLEARARGFEEVMAYFHVDRAIGYLEELGFRGQRAIFRAPLSVNARATHADSSWYSPGRKELNFGLGGGVNDAEDAETILHEFGHALQDAICPDFGQSAQAAAMGEGFGDYFALSFFEERPARYRDCVMTWDGLTWEDRGVRCVRRHGRDRTLESFDPAEGEHENGRLWAETLLAVKDELGRRAADTLIVESHFQQDGFTNFARGARAIVDADANLHAGRHRAALRAIFAWRGIGPV
jgi:hypothetical protein